MTELSEELGKFEKVIETHPDMYKYAEVYITILNGQIIGLFSIIRNQKPEEARVMEELPESDFKIVRECWNIETLFSNIQKDEIKFESLHGTFPFLWSDKEYSKKYDKNISFDPYESCGEIKETKKPGFISSSFKEHYYRYCYRQHGTGIHEWVSHVDQINPEIKSMGYSSLSDLYRNVVPYSDYIRSNPNPLLYLPGFDLVVPIYLKFRSCGVNKNRMLEVTVESIGIPEDAEIHVSDFNDKNNELPKSLSISKYEEPVLPVLGENKGGSKFYKVLWEVPDMPDKYEKLKVELSLTSDTSLVSLNVITNIKKEIKKFNTEFPKWEIRENKFINFLKRHSLLIFSSVTVILLLISIYFIKIHNYLAITSIIGLIGVYSVYLKYRTYIRDMKERDHETAEKTLTKLTDLKDTYKKCSYLIENSLIKKESNDSFFQLMDFDSFADNYIPLEIRDFVIEETPEILEKHRRLMEQLNEYVLGAVDIQIRNKTEDEINSIIKKCKYEISRLTREYRLGPVEQEHEYVYIS